MNPIKKYALVFGVFAAVLTYFVLGTGWYVPARLVISGTVPEMRGKINVSWDSGAGWNSYENERFAINTRPKPGQGADHTVTIRATGEKYPGSLSADVVCTRVQVDGQPIDPVRWSANGGERVGRGIRLTGPESAIELSVPAREHIRIELATNTRSGRAAVTVNGQTRVHELYQTNIEARTVGLDYWVVQSDGAFTVFLDLPRYAIDRLKIDAERGPPVYLRSVAVRSERGNRQLLPASGDALKSIQFHHVNRGLKRYFLPMQFGWQVVFAALGTWLLSALYSLGVRCGGFRALLLAEKRYIFWLFFTGAATVYALWLTAFWPGVLSVDSLKVWRAARLPDVVIANHPQAYVLFYRFLFHIWGHVAVVPVGHIVLMAVFIAHVFFRLYRQGVPRAVLLPFYMLVVFSVPVGLYNTVLWKDIPFALLVVFWAYSLADFRLRRRKGELRFSLQQAIAFFLLYLAVGFIRPNGMVYLAAIPFFLIWVGVVPMKTAAVALAVIVVSAASMFWMLRSKISIHQAGYLVEKSVQMLKPVLDRSLTKELKRTATAYWGIFNINQTRTKWDKWHYYLGDRQAYWFLKLTGWRDAYPYLPDDRPVWPKLKETALKIYWKTYARPWVYGTWNPVFALALLPLAMVLIRWFPLSAIFSAFVLIQVVALLGIVNTMNWRYYYFAYLSVFFLPYPAIHDWRHLREQGADSSE